MRRLRAFLAALLVAFLATHLPGCALFHQEGRQQAKAPPTSSEEWLRAGCDRPFEELLALLHTGCDLKTVLPGRKITLKECVRSALQSGRLGADNIRVKTFDLSMGLEQARTQGANSRESQKLYLTLEVGTLDLILSVETAYWRLIQARGVLLSREDAVKALDEEAKTVKERFDEKLLTRQDVDSVEEQRQLAKVECLTALNGLREAEWTLRRTAGFCSHDGSFLVPCDLPVLLPPACDSATDLHEAKLFRPELALARVQLDIACDELRAVKDEKLKPAARLKVEREEVAFHDAEEVMVYDLQKSQRVLAQVWQALEALKAREEAAHRRLEAVTEKWESKEFGELRELLQARVGFSTAQRETLQGIVEYQIALAEHLRRKGVLLKHHRICIERQDPRPGD